MGIGMLLPFPLFMGRVLASACGLAVGYGVAWLGEQYALRHYHCPKCKRFIFLERDRMECPILFTCRTCHIEWDTGLRNNDLNADGGGSADASHSFDFSSHDCGGIWDGGGVGGDGGGGHH